MMARGIQPGTTASSAESIALENSLKNAVFQAFHQVSKLHPEGALEWKSKITGEWLRNNMEHPRHFIDYHNIYENPEDSHFNGAQPDGGAIFYLGFPVALFEAKKQGDAGNAIERWYKNFFIFSNLSLPFKPLYVTLMTGEGARPGGVMSTCLTSALTVHGRTFNHLYPEGLSVYRSIEAFNSTTLNFIAYNAITLGVELCRQHIPDIQLRKRLSILANTH